MNSLQFISHQLFVEAIGNEDRTPAGPIRPERPSRKAGVPADAIAFEVLDDRKPLPAGSSGPLQVAVSQTLS